MKPVCTFIQVYVQRHTFCMLNNVINASILYYEYRRCYRNKQYFCNSCVWWIKSQFFLHSSCHSSCTSMSRSPRLAGFFLVLVTKWNAKSRYNQNKMMWTVGGKKVFLPSISLIKLNVQRKEPNFLYKFFF